MTSAVAIVDAVMNDLEGVAGIIPVSTVRYVEPTVADPDQLPMLACWVPETRYTLEVTPDQYMRTHQVFVAWYELNTSGAEYGGRGDADVLLALEEQLEAITRRLATYGGGVPNLGADVVATLVRVTYEPTEGVAWEGRVEMNVETLLGW